MDNVTPVQDRAKAIRGFIEQSKVDVGEFIKALKSGDLEEVGEKTDKDEQIANAILCFRHLEDAKMRLGKVIQATVGESVYDTK